MWRLGTQVRAATALVLAASAVALVARTASPSATHTALAQRYARAPPGAPRAEFEQLFFGHAPYDEEVYLPEVVEVEPPSDHDWLKAHLIYRCTHAVFTLYVVIAVAHSIVHRARSKLCTLSIVHAQHCARMLVLRASYSVCRQQLHEGMMMMRERELEDASQLCAFDAPPVIVQGEPRGEGSEKRDRDGEGARGAHGRNAAAVGR